MIVNIFSDHLSFVEESAETIARCCRSSDKTLARIIVSGGSTPRPVYQAFAEKKDVPFEKVEFFQADERYVSPTHRDSNYFAIKNALGAKTVNRLASFHHFHTQKQIEEALDEYERILKNIPFFDPRREEFLEFDITQLIFQTRQTQKPKLGILSMLPVFGSSPELEGIPGFQGRSEPWVFIEELKKSFDVEKVESNVETIDSKFTSLLVIHPKNLSENTEKAIDQFILRGGKAMIFFDPSASQDPSEQMNPFQQQQPPSRFGLQNIFRAWGVEFAVDQIVADSKYATMVNSQGGNVRYPLWLMLSDKEAITEKEIITSELKNILMVTPGAIKTTGNDYQVRPLLKSSPKSQLFNKMMAGYMQPLDLMQQLKPDNEAKVLAAILEGQFKTAFPNETKAGWLKNSESSNAVFLIADTDMLFDNYMIRKFNFLGQTISQPLNDNLAMIMNAADFLGGSSALISIRSRGKFARPFTKVQDIETKAQEKWQKEEEMLTQKLNAVQKRINDLQAQKEDGSKLVLSQAQLEEVKKFREEEANTKKSRREIRKILREDVDSLGTILTIINVTLIPLIVSAFGFLAFRRRIQMASSGRQ